MHPLLARIEQLEFRLQLLQRELAGANCRQASPAPQRRGWWLAVFNGSLSHGGTAEAEILRWSDEWKRTTKKVTVRDFWLNKTEDPIAAGTLAKVEWYDTTWVPTSIYCKVNDWLDSEGGP